MTEFLDKTFWGNTVLDWFVAIGIVMLCYIGAKVILYFTNKVVRKFTEKTKTQLDDILIDKLEEPLAVAVTIAGLFWAVEYLHIPNPSAEKFLNKLLLFGLVLNVTWAVARTLDALISEYLVPLTEKTNNSFDDQLVPIAQKAAKYTIWSLGIVLALDNLDFDIGAMIAGLGIGGLALALAAQDAVKNIFGGIMIFVDKPFKLGDRIQINGFDGIVEMVGLRSTRVRTLDGRLVTMPNSKFNDNEITNVTLEPNTRIILKLGLTYETPPEKIELANSILKDIVNTNQDEIDEKHFISFNDFGDFSLGITFVYFIRKEGDFFNTQNKISMQILKRFNENGLEFAFPTQTIYKKELV